MGQVVKGVGPAGGPALVAKIAASGAVRTRKDAEALRDYMVANGYDREMVALWRAVLALLGDLSALATLRDPEYQLALHVYKVMKASYIGDSECRCIRTPTGGVAKELTSCPVHGETPGALPGYRNLDGLMKPGGAR